MSLSTLAKKFNLFWATLSTPGIVDRILLGLKNTFLIALIGFVIGFILGSILAVFKLLPQNKKGFKLLSKLADVYIAIFRGTPIVVQLLVAYYFLLPLFNISADGLTVAEVVFGLNSAAYVAEIMRGGILSVDKGQMEAGRSVGLSYLQTMFLIVLPQAIKNILPALGNEMITLLKDTSLVSVIALRDVTKQAQNIVSKTYEPYIPYISLAVIYLVIVIILTRLLGILERRLRKSER